MPVPEVHEAPSGYGLDVKAAATAVDEKLADAALTGKPKPKAAAANGAAAKKPAAQPLQARAGFGHGTARAPRAENMAPPPSPSRSRSPSPVPATASVVGRSAPRPTRSSLQGGALAGAGGVRRVVIDSQASRRPGGPGGGPGGPGRRSRWPRRSEPSAAPSRWPSPPWHVRRARRAGHQRAQGRRHPRQLRVDRQGRRGVPGRARAGGHQEVDGPRRDGHADADAQRRRHPGARRRVRQADRDRHGRRGRQRRPDVRGRRRRSRCRVRP